jgi:hypothetical protein|tara:strand:+ start:348 stop:503 length:156 start_codon:yes stop_codon:yes gene_type:complete
MKEEKIDGVQLEKLLAKYEKEYENMIVMDDYDGGRKECLRVVIEDLRKKIR